MLDLRNCDNMELMAGLPDKSIDLAIVDPPYGLDMGTYERYGYKGKEHLTGRYKAKKWDTDVPDDAYFAELFRVSKNQIIWGGNYFPLGPTQCFVFWYKQNPVPNFSDGELAWTSFDRPALCFPFKYYGNLEEKTTATKKIHPTQKPVALYEFLLSNFAKPGDKILDTHLGSANIAIACHYFGVDLIGCEKDPDIYADAMHNVKENTTQVRAIAPIYIPYEQTELFSA